MNSPAQALAHRLRELRRRHFGAQGKALFAQRLGLPEDEYARYERGVVPPGDVLVRICETTGEDLQWLLTGVASRGTVVIAEARGRHRTLLTRVANLLEQKPAAAAPLDAFLDLLDQSEHARRPRPAALPDPTALIRVFELDDLPPTLPTDGPDGPGRFELATLPDGEPLGPAESMELVEPAVQYSPGTARNTTLVTVRAADGRTYRCLQDPVVTNCFGGAFGARLTDDTMRPMFDAGDCVIVSIGCAAKVGRPALCRFADQPPARCRIWLGTEGETVSLGRLADGAVEQVPRTSVLWSLEALFRLAPAA